MDSYLSIGGKLQIAVVKSGGQPSDREMKDLFDHSEVRGDFAHEIRGHSSDSLRALYETARATSSLPDPAAMSAEQVVQHGLLLAYGTAARENGITGMSLGVVRVAGNGALGLYLLKVTREDAADVENETRFPASALAPPRWQIWAKTPAPHLEDHECVLNGYALACGPQVIAKYRDRNPPPYSGCALEIRRPDDAKLRSAELSFEVTCRVCKKTYGLTNDLSGGMEGVRDTHVNCPTCRSHRWYIRTLGYWTKGRGFDAWVMNIITPDDHLRSSNVTVTRIKPCA